MEDHGNKGIVLRETRVHLYIHVYHVSKHMCGKYELMNISRVDIAFDPENMYQR